MDIYKLLFSTGKTRKLIGNFSAYGLHFCQKIKDKFVFLIWRHLMYSEVIEFDIVPSGRMTLAYVHILYGVTLFVENTSTIQ